MDRVMFLNSSGAIVTRFRPCAAPIGSPLIAEEPLAVAPHVEPVALPVVSVDSSALYGDHPENLATLTVSSGAALTFFCDSVSGGQATGGNGSFDDPWRSLNTASQFLACNACVLRAAAPYVQLKVRGVVDYVSGLWRPFDDYDRFIIAGWSGRCDLGGSGEFGARYLFDVRGRAYADTATYSACTVVDGHGSHTAVDCLLESGGGLYCAYNCSCSGAPRSGYLSATVCSGGSFGYRLLTEQICSSVISASSSGEYASLTALTARAAVGVSVAATVTATGQTAIVNGIYGGAYLAGCSVNVTASVNYAGSFTAGARAYVVGSDPGAVVVAGGVYSATAVASAETDYPVAAASALASGFGGSAVVSGASVYLNAHAGAKSLDADGEETEYERLGRNGSSFWESRVRQLSGGVVTSTWTSSGSYSW